ncbi:STAS domain-containing protein [Streptomyces sp. NPDC058662]|uniref:STAS domain-containing protein n=1 Tax=Streptomyces sp. NPDC058662 TaxID=3346583 RepID=UPI003663BE16
MQSTFDTAIEYAGNTVLISAAGVLDAHAAPALAHALDPTPDHTAVALVDLHGVHVMDEPGLGLLLDLRRRAEDLGLRVLVVGWQAQPRQLLELLSLDGEDAGEGPGGTAEDGPGRAADDAAGGDPAAARAFCRVVRQRAEQERAWADVEAEASGKGLHVRSVHDMLARIWRTRPPAGDSRRRRV